jgi:ABC-type uncharacterized transport system ATPase subunit
MADNRGMSAPATHTFGHLLPGGRDAARWFVRERPRAREHLLNFLNQITDHVIVLNAGTKLFEGTLKAASADRDVVAAFLGG